MSSNQCINEDFSGAPRIAKLQQTVNEKCSFDAEENNSVETSTTVTRLLDDKCSQTQDLTTDFVNITLQGIKAETSEVISKLDELKSQQKEECGNNIARALEAQTMSHTKALEAQAKTVKEQTSEIIDVNKKLAISEAQITLKMSEIERLN